MSQDKELDLPTVPAYQVLGTSSIAVWCQWCSGWHLHGAAAGGGARAAHCTRPGGPYPSGYSLKVEGTLTMDELHGADRSGGAPRRPTSAVAVTNSEDALAYQFALDHAGYWRFCNQLGAWFEWAGGRWRRDDAQLVLDRARLVCREAAHEALLAGGTPRCAEKLASAATARAVLALASADPRLATGADEWDADPWQLNTPGGIVDLRTGILQPHDPAALCSKITAVRPKDRPAPLWMKFLETVTAGDLELQHYLQRVAGYCLTGSIAEHALFFFYGTGSNGKGTFLNTLTAILGDYAKIAPMSTFTETNREQHPTDLAMMRGARLVCSQETEGGGRWAENRIKALTGGDPVTARFMRRDFFTYNPEFKLLIAGNHKPALRTVDDAIRRRIHLVPFTTRIDPAQRDRKLFDKLKEEWPQILSWAVDGCAEWQLAGELHPPAAVRAATDDYLAEQDSVRTWLAECCNTDLPTLCTSTAGLFKSWTAWVQEHGERAGSSRGFSQALQRLGFEAVKHLPGHRNTRGFRGIAVRQNDIIDQWQPRDGD